MENIEIISSTDETVRFTPKSTGQAHHHQAKTTDLRRTRRTFSKEKSRNFSKPTDSTSTLIENTKISQSLNSHNLKLSLKSIYAQDPVAQLKEIFKSKPLSSPKAQIIDHPRFFSGNLPRRNRMRSDSIYHQNEANLILDELKTIKSPQVWQKIMQKFKQRPSALMDLIQTE